MGTPSHLGHMDRVAATMTSQAHAGAAQKAPDIGHWEGQDVPLVRPSSCNVKGGIPSSRRYLPTYLGPAAFLLVPVCPLRVCALALPRRPLPPPSWVVWLAHLARSRHWVLVGLFQVVGAPPRVLPRSLAPSGVLGGGRSGPGSPLPGLGLCAPCGGGRVGVTEGRPRGGAFHRCEGRLWSGAPPPLTARPLGGLLGSATHVLRARACGCGGPSRSPWPACPVGAACRGGGGGPSPGAVTCHRCEGRLVSGAVPPPDVRSLGRAAGVPRPACPGCGRCGRGDPAPAPQRAPLPAGIARCGGGGRASPGGVPSTIVRGVWCQALSLPRPPVLWSGQPGFRDPCVPGALGAGVGTQHWPHSVRPCGPALLAMGLTEGRPRGGCLQPL